MVDAGSFTVDKALRLMTQVSDDDEMQDLHLDALIQAAVDYRRQCIGGGAPEMQHTKSQRIIKKLLLQMTPHPDYRKPADRREHADPSTSLRAAIEGTSQQAPTDNGASA